MSSLKFGTSGLRGLVTDLEGAPSESYAAAFLRHLAESGRPPRALLIGRDLRASSVGIAADCARAAARFGIEAIDAGAVPTPALAAEAFRRGHPAIMVTGSHIPDDRNGLKFYIATGEITKDDEAGILAAHAADARPDAAAAVARDASWGEDAREATSRAYLSRNLDFFGPGALAGLLVALYEHSSVGRDVLHDILEGLGASVTRLGRSERFVAVDTEAHRPEDREAILGWTADGRFDAVVSTDGDADRPLVADERGQILRGDILGLLTARFLDAATVVTPVTSSSSIERIMRPSGSNVIRTRVGSPFVIAGMLGGGDRTLGFEANGGVILGSDFVREGRRLPALPTRDAVLPILVALHDIRTRGEPLGRIVEGLDAGFTAAGRLPHVPAELSTTFLQKLHTDAFRNAFFADQPVEGVDALDGVRVMLGDGSVVHYRASGNAPELRCYIEARDQAEADRLLALNLDAASNALGR